MSEIQRQHPSGMAILGLIALKNFFVSQGTREFVIPFAIFLWLGLRNLPIIFPALVVLLFLLSFVAYGFLKWYNFYFYVKDGELVIHHGVWVRNKISLSREKIQAIDLNFGIWQRLFGVVALNVQTAGESESETEISALKREDADILIQELGEEKLQEEDEEKAAKPEYGIPLGRLLLAGSTSSNFIFIFAIFSFIAAQIINRIDFETFIEYIDVYFGMLISNMFVLFFAVLLLTWLISVLTHLYSNYGFKLVVEKDRLIIHRGFFEKQQISIPYKRIQAVRIEEGWIRQALGFANIHVDSAGFGSTPGEATMLMPLLRTEEIPDFLKNTVPEYAFTAPSITPPARAITRYMFRSLYLPLIIGGILAYFFHFILLVPLLIYGSIMGYLRFKDAGAGLLDQHVFFRFRDFSRNTVIIKKKRVQSVTIIRNFMQKRRNLASLSFFVASAGGGNGYAVSDLNTEEAFHFMYWVSPNVSAEPETIHEQATFSLPAFVGLDVNLENKGFEVNSGDENE